jgi:hypothetical protein
MSDIFISDIVGEGVFAIPDGNLDMTDTANAFLIVIENAVISVGLYDFVYVGIYAWIRDGSPAGGGEGTRSLCMFVDAFALDPRPGAAEECPTAAQMDSLFAAIKAALEAEADITSIGTQQATLYFSGHYAE